MSKKIYEEIDTNGVVKKFYTDHFIYTVPVAALIQGATVTQNIQIEANSSFVWVKSSFNVVETVSGDATNEPQINVSIVDGGSGRFLQNLPVPLVTLAGQRGLPMVLPQEREFEPNSNIQFTFNSRATIDYKNVELVLIGYKKFYV